MNYSRRISVIDTHNAGEPMRIVTGGFPFLPGSNMVERQAFFADNYDFIRRMVMHEPRGHSDMFGGLLCEPSAREADLGVIFFDAGRYYHMCGHGAMALAGMAVETGLVDKKVPLTEVVLDTSAGLVTLRVKCSDNSLESVTMDSNPSFLYREGLEIELPELGAVRFDLAFGGNFFVLVDVSQFHQQLSQREIAFYLRWGIKLIEECNRKFQVQHPVLEHINEITDLMFYQSLGATEGKNVVILGKGQFDRSPCGTGTSSRLAALYHQGKLELEQRYTHYSIIDSHFTAWAKEEKKVGDRKGVVISLQSRPFITGFSEFVISEEDPLKNGFLVDRV